MGVTDEPPPQCLLFSHPALTDSSTFLVCTTPSSRGWARRESETLFAQRPSPLAMAISLPLSAGTSKPNRGGQAFFNRRPELGE